WSSDVCSSDLSAAAAADHDDVLISRVLRLLRAAVHGKPFRLRQNDVVLEIRVYVGLYIFGVSPSGRAVLRALAVFLRVFPFDIDYQADNHRTDNADKQIQRVNARQGVFKGCGKSLCDIQYLCRNIRAGGKPHRLSDFIKEIDKEHIGDIRKYQLFVVDLLHISRPLSIFFTLSRAALSCFALSFAAARALRIEAFSPGSASLRKTLETLRS